MYPPFDAMPSHAAKPEERPSRIMSSEFLIALIKCHSSPVGNAHQFFGPGQGEKSHKKAVTLNVSLSQVVAILNRKFILARSLQHTAV